MSLLEVQVVRFTWRKTFRMRWFLPWLVFSVVGAFAWAVKGMQVQFPVNFFDSQP